MSMLIMDSTRRRFLHYDFKFYSYWWSPLPSENPYWMPIENCKHLFLTLIFPKLEVYLFQWSFKRKRNPVWWNKLSVASCSFCIFIQHLHLGNILVSSKCHLLICSLGIHLDRDTPNIHFQDEHELWITLNIVVQLQCSPGNGWMYPYDMKVYQPYWNCHKGYYEHRLSWPKKTACYIPPEDHSGSWSFFFFVCVGIW